jgi:AbrB family looped-hinge helix DNA binding protein
MTKAKVGSRYQVVIPKAERRRVKLRPHSIVNVEARENYLVLYPVTGHGWRGIGRALADGTDATDYVKKLRSEWESGR